MKMSSVKQAFLHWLPRVIGILMILFISIFALDAFNPKFSLARQLLDFFMHLIPSFIFLGFLLVAWRWERVGGIIFLIIGLIFSMFVFYHNYFVNRFSFGQCLLVVLLVGIPFVLVGVLFMISSHQQKQVDQHH